MQKHEPMIVIHEVPWDWRLRGLDYSALAFLAFNKTEQSRGRGRGLIPVTIAALGRATSDTHVSHVRSNTPIYWYTPS
jgi:hypothetical protein